LSWPPDSSACPYTRVASCPQRPVADTWDGYQCSKRLWFPLSTISGHAILALMIGWTLAAESFNAGPYVHPSRGADTLPDSFEYSPCDSRSARMQSCVVFAQLRNVTHASHETGSRERSVGHKREYGCHGVGEGWRLVRRNGRAVEKRTGANDELAGTAARPLCERCDCRAGRVAMRARTPIATAPERLRCGRQRRWSASE